MKGFAFELGAAVRLMASGEAGSIKGRAEYTHSENCYYILYKAADGRQVSTWWGESEIQEV